MNKTIHTDIAIIGAGVLGVSLAYHLAEQNIDCLVVEKEPFPAAHASGKNAGMLRQLYRHPQLSEWAMRSIASMPSQLKEKHFMPSGSLIVGRELPDHHSELFTLKSIETTRGKAPAVFSKNDGLLDSPSYVNDLCSLGKQKGARYLFKEEICEISKQSSSWFLECKSGQKIESQQVVNAAGAWVNSFIKESSEINKSNIKAFARHLLLIKGWQKEYMPQKECGFYWDEREHWYMRKWDKDSRLVSVCDQVACTPETFTPNSEIASHVSETLLRELPAQASNLKLGRGWHCFRSYTEDKMPMWGEDKDCSGLFWLAGFGGYGMSTSFAATKEAAHALMGKKVTVSEDFLPARAYLSEKTTFS